MLKPISLEITDIVSSPLPISLALVRDHVAVDGTDNDTLLTQNTLAAINWAESVMHRTVYQRSHTWTLADFPRVGVRAITLPRGKVQSVTSVSYTDSSGTFTLSGPSSSPPGTGYQDLLGGSFGFIQPTQGNDWPDIDVEAIAPVQIEFVAGWPTAEVPDAITQAILFTVSDLFEIRGAADLNRAGSNFQARHILLSSFKVRNLYT